MPKTLQTNRGEGEQDGRRLLRGWPCCGAHPVGQGDGDHQLLPQVQLCGGLGWPWWVPRTLAWPRSPPTSSTSPYNFSFILSQNIYQEEQESLTQLTQITTCSS